MSEPIRHPDAEEDELGRMGLLEHLDELRRRLVYAFTAFGVAFLVCWAFASRIYDFLARPIEDLLPEGEQLVFLNVTDPFLIYVKVAALAGLFASSPVILYQAWAFIAPGLYRRERYMAGPFIFFGSLLFLVAGADAHRALSPAAGPKESQASALHCQLL